MKKVLLFIGVLLVMCVNGTAQRRYTNEFLINDINGVDKKMIEVHFDILVDNSFIITPDYTKKGDTIHLYEFIDEHVEFVLTRAYIGTITNDSIKKVITSQIKDIVRKLHNFYYLPIVSITGNGISNFSSSSPNAYNNAGSTAGFGLNIKLAKRYEMVVIGTVAETRDTIDSQDKNAFATSVLVPGVRKFSLLFNLRDIEFFCKNWGAGLFVNVTPMNWRTFTAKSKINNPSSTVMDSLQIFKTVSPLTIELYASYFMYNNEYDSPTPANSVRINFDFGLTFKTLGGSLTNSERNFFIGSESSTFGGVFGGINLHFSGSRAYFYGSYISEDVSGLSGFQLVGGIGLSANIAKLLN